MLAKHVLTSSTFGNCPALASINLCRMISLKAVGDNGFPQTSPQSNVVYSQCHVPSFMMSIETCLRPYWGVRLGYTGSRTNEGVI